MPYQLASHQFGSSTESLDEHLQQLQPKLQEQDRPFNAQLQNDSGQSQAQVASQKIRSTFGSLQSHFKFLSESHKHDFSTLQGESRRRQLLTSGIGDQSSDSSIKKYDRSDLTTPHSMVYATFREESLKSLSSMTNLQLI